MADSRKRPGRTERKVQPPEAYERLALVYDELGFDRFTRLALNRCRDYLAESERTVTKLLDLACGTGHFAIAMAKLGISVTGVDRAREMLKAAQRNAGRMKNPPAWRQGDFLSFRGPGKNDLITCWFDALNHLLTDRDTLACFKRVHSELARGGAFIFDVNTPAAFHEQWNQTVYRSRTSYVYIERGIAEPDGEFARMEAEAFIKRGKHYERLHMPFYQRSFTPARTRRLLRLAGFTRIRIEPFAPDQPLERTTRLFVSAERSA